jgi:hypothetical protein
MLFRSPQQEVLRSAILQLPDCVSIDAVGMDGEMEDLMIASVELENPWNRWGI